MALIVEDGLSRANSEAYGSVADCTTYYSNMGYSDTASEASLRRGSRWLDSEFIRRWKGTKASATQAMQWPRYGMTDEDDAEIGWGEIPDAIKRASFEAARKVDVAMTVDESKSIQSVKAGSFEVTFAFPQREQETLDFIYKLVRPYIRPSGILVRA